MSWTPEREEKLREENLRKTNIRREDPGEPEYE